MKNNIYDDLKEDIITCKYPPQYVLEEKFLADKYNVSRTPIREIMNTLKQEGWLERYANKKGLRVSQINLKRVKDLFQLRYELEPLILKLAFRNIDKEMFTSLKNQLIENKDNLQIKKLVTLDDAFHNHILISSNNEIAIKFAINMMDQIRRIRYLTHENEEVVLKSANVHINIINHILDDNLEYAQEALREHIDEGQIYFFRNMIL